MRVDGPFASKPIPKRRTRLLHAIVGFSDDSKGLHGRNARNTELRVTMNCGRPCMQQFSIPSMSVIYVDNDDDNLGKARRKIQILKSSKRV